MSAIREEIARSNAVRKEDIHSDPSFPDAFAVRSFRIAHSDFDRLQREARERNVSVNMIVDEIIRRHVEYDQVLRKFRIIHLGSPHLKLLFDALSEDKIIEISETVANDPLFQDWPFVLEVSGESSAKGILNTMKLLAKYDSFEVSEIDHDSKKIVFFAHDVGRHWSLYMATLWKTVFELAGVPVKTRFDDRAAIFEFEKSQLV